LAALAAGKPAIDAPKTPRIECELSVVGGTAQTLGLMAALPVVNAARLAGAAAVSIQTALQASADVYAALMSFPLDRMVTLIVSKRAFLKQAREMVLAIKNNILLLEKEGAAAYGEDNAERIAEAQTIIQTAEANLRRLENLGLRGGTIYRNQVKVELARIKSAEVLLLDVETIQEKLTNFDEDPATRNQNLRKLGVPIPTSSKGIGYRALLAFNQIGLQGTARQIQDQEASLQLLRDNLRKFRDSVDKLANTPAANIFVPVLRQVICQLSSVSADMTSTIEVNNFLLFYTKRTEWWMRLAASRNVASGFIGNLPQFPDPDSGDDEQATTLLALNDEVNKLATPVVEELDRIDARLKVAGGASSLVVRLTLLANLVAKAVFKKTPAQPIVDLCDVLLSQIDGLDEQAQDESSIWSDKLDFFLLDDNVPITAISTLLTTFATEGMSELVEAISGGDIEALLGIVPLKASKDEAGLTAANRAAETLRLSANPQCKSLLKDALVLQRFFRTRIKAKKMATNMLQKHADEAKQEIDRVRIPGLQAVLAAEKQVNRSPCL
jgi:hypothetical protein